jgi:hypothetical protein
MTNRRILPAQAHGKVFDLSGKQLGRVDRLLIDVASGKVTSMVIALPSTASATERLLTVPWEAVGFDPERGGFLLNLPLETLLEVFDADRWPQPGRPEGDPTGAK